MTLPTIDTLPQPPNRASPTNFSQLMDAFLIALVVFPAQANALGAQANADGALASRSAATAVNAPGTSATSTTSTAVGTGSKTLTIQAGKNFVVGMWVTIARTSAPATYLCGYITAYDATAGTLTIASQFSAGTGTFTDWTIGLSPPVAFPTAAVADVLAGTSTVLGITPAALIGASAPALVTDAATVTPDLNVALNYNWTLGANRTLANPANATLGKSGSILLTQDSTGGRTLAFGSAWKFPGGAPLLSTAAGAVDLLTYLVWSPTLITCALLRGFA